MPLSQTALALGVRALLALPPRVQLALAGGRPRRGDDGELDPGLQLLLAAQSRRGREGLTQADVAQARADRAADGGMLVPRRTPVGSVRDLTVDGASGPLPARHYRPPVDAARELVDDRPAPLLVYLHGGGFVFGDLDGVDEPCRLLCRHAGVHVLSVDYRLAPEDPFPAGPDDAVAALRWAHENAAALGADPSRVGVGGDSAGANLATVAALDTRGTPWAPVAQVLVYPVTDSSRRHPSRERFAEGFLLTDADMTWFEGHYEGSSQATHPRRSPLLTEDLGGAAPAALVTAAFDPLRDEGEAYAGRLADAGVPVTAWRVPSLVHGFLAFAAVHRPSRDATLQLAGVVRSLLHGGGRASTGAAGTGADAARTGAAG
ncbi:alpha/beta hydrolase [Thalassiella azotivora]